MVSPRPISQIRSCRTAGVGTPSEAAGQLSSLLAYRPAPPSPVAKPILSRDLEAEPLGSRPQLRTPGVVPKNSEVGLLWLGEVALQT